MSLAVFMIPVFWFLGLIGIGIAGRILAGAISPATTKDKDAQRLVVGWCTLIALAWAVVGGCIVLDVLLHQIR